MEDIGSNNPNFDISRERSFTIENIMLHGKIGLLSGIQEGIAERMIRLSCLFTVFTNSFPACSIPMTGFYYRSLVQSSIIINKVGKVDDFFFFFS